VDNSKDSPPLNPYLSCFDQVLEEDNRVNRLVSISTFLSLSFRTVPHVTVGRLIQAMDNDSFKSTTEAYKSYLIFE
jgi:hypothetical protein